jgi:hypothetical protein
VSIVFFELCAKKVLETFGWEMITYMMSRGKSKIIATIAGLTSQARILFSYGIHRAFCVVSMIDLVD